jgi:Zn ribbon nucleic-acid-binding protein
MDHWLIYIHTNKLEGPQAKRFNSTDEIQEWTDEHENIKILDCVPCSEDDE